MADLAGIFRDARRIVFLTGAGMSTESGLPDFRGEGGLWRGEDMTYLLSRWAFEQQPEKFYAFFREAFVPWLEAEPNRGHGAIAKLEDLGYDVTVVTQNIDGLHQRAGSSMVLELHGHLRTVHCPRCDGKYPIEVIIALDHSLPLCTECEALLKPAVVLFGDPLPTGVFSQAVEFVSAADVVCVVGTSLTVSPANTLVTAVSPEASLVVINQTPTFADQRAALICRDKAGRVLWETTRTLVENGCA